MLISVETVARIAALAEADRGTVTRYLAGMPVRPLARQRIERALRELGLLDRLQPAPEKTA